MHGADRLVLVKQVSSEGISVFYWPAGKQVPESAGWSSSAVTYHTGMVGFCHVNVVSWVFVVQNISSMPISFSTSRK